MASWRVDKESGGKLKDLNWGHGLDSKLGETTKSYHPSSFTLLIRSLRSHYRRSVKTQKIRSKMFICNTLSRSPKQLLRTLLQGTITSTSNFTLRNCRDQQKVSLPDQGFIEQDQLFPIKRSRNSYPVCYISPIAHRLAAKSTQSASEIAANLVARLRVYQSHQLQNCADSALPRAVLQALTIHATTAGYIQFDFSDQAIAEYLNLLTHSLPSDPDLPSSLAQLSSAVLHLHHRIFLLQHTHARCCSWLRLAHQNKFIQLNSQLPDSQLAYWQITDPKFFPWLNATFQFRTGHATELQLIAHIVTVLDALTEWHSDCPSASTLPASTVKSAITLLTAAEELGQAFHANYQHWQLMGNLRSQGCDRLQAHLGLILITQRLLYHLLQNLVGIEMPFEL